MRIIHLLLITLLCLISVNPALHGTSYTFFEYRTSDLNALRKLQSQDSFSAEELKKWDLYCQQVVDRLGLKYDYRNLFFTYLYAAQRDAIFLSFEAKECYEGSFDPISAKIFQLFFPNEPLPSEVKNDPFSAKLAIIILKKYAARFEKRGLSLLQNGSFGG